MLALTAVPAEFFFTSSHEEDNLPVIIFFLLEMAALISFNKLLSPIFRVGLSSAELKLNIDLCVELWS